MTSLLEKYEIDDARLSYYVPDGWVDIVDRLMADLIELGWDKELHQVKEKFGGLRFYTGNLTDEQYERVGQAEKESYKTCEVCGKSGKARNNIGWVRTLCEKHYVKKLMELEASGRKLDSAAQQVLQQSRTEK